VTATLDAWLEITEKKAFAGAIDWPGWERSGRDAEAALARLAEYGPRFARVLAGSGLGFKAPAGPDAFDVLERIPGNATTAFGAPGLGPTADERSLDEAGLDRLTRILEAAWRALDAAVAAAAGVTLTSGPRGGGRSVEKILDHVFEAEGGYLTAFGVRPQKTESGEGRMAVRRAETLAALRARSRGQPIANPSNTKRLWTPRFFVRRAAWHVLDHAWEIEDRSGRPG